MCISSIKSSMLWTIFKKVFEFWRERNSEFGVGALPGLKFEVRGVKSDLEDIGIRMCFFQDLPQVTVKQKMYDFIQKHHLQVLMNEIYVVCQLEKKWLLKVFKGRIIQHIKTAQKELYILNKLYQF